MSVNIAICTLIAGAICLSSCTSQTNQTNQRGKGLRGKDIFAYVANKCGEQNGVSGVKLSTDADRNNAFTFSFPDGVDEQTKQKIHICTAQEMEKIVAQNQN